MLDPVPEARGASDEESRRDSLGVAARVSACLAGSTGAATATAPPPSAEAPPPFPGSIAIAFRARSGTFLWTVSPGLRVLPGLLLAGLLVASLLRLARRLRGAVRSRAILRLRSRGGIRGRRTLRSVTFATPASSAPSVAPLAVALVCRRRLLLGALPLRVRLGPLRPAAIRARSALLALGLFLLRLLFFSTQRRRIARESLGERSFDLAIELLPLGVEPAIRASLPALGIRVLAGAAVDALR